MSAPPRKLGPILYGLLFCGLFPLGLALWARATANRVHLPVLESPLLGGALATLGGALFLASIHALWTFGGGLPMNAYPPPRFVRRGVYHFLDHPIYVGAVLVAAGLSLALGSASGLWLVTPALALASAALVLGYEREDLARRFGSDRPRAWLHLPLAKDRPAKVSERVSFFVLVFLPWLILYEVAVAVGTPPGAFSTWLPGEADWPVWTWTEAIYLSSYVITPAAVLLLPTSRQLRAFALEGLIATALNVLLYLTVPAIAPPRSFEPSGLWGQVLAFEQLLEGTTGAGCFPSFHVTWAVLTARALTRNGGVLGRLAWPWCVLLSLSCATTGMHSVLDILAGFAVGLAVGQYPRLWRALLFAAEHVANAWREWSFGPVRFLSHGVYGGIGATIGVLAMASFAGADRWLSILFLALSGLVGAALWAQIIEGASVSLRPFGYYGSVVGAAIGGLALQFFADSRVLLGALALAAPWTQSLGRLRCLIQGCCHGRACAAELGIRYFHPRSRVTRLSTLGGQYVHASPLHSILWNIATGALLLRLAVTDVPALFIVGAYLFLNGGGRFVEEAYRGEPQTPRVAGLAIYQWNAIVSMLAGAALTCAPGAPLPAPVIDLGSVALALGFGLLTTLALGVDFPESNRRFARLVK